jgi:archaellum component FlaC
MPQTIGAIMEILSDVQSQLTSLSHGFEEQKKRQVKADAVLKHLSRQ